MTLVVVLGSQAPSQVHAQSHVNVETARQYVDQLDRDYWERAWLDHLHEEANGDGTIEWTYEKRQQLHDLTTDYQRVIHDAEGFWTNLQVQDYLQRQFLFVQPNPMMPGRPGTFRLRVLSTSTPNALALNDGTIILTTGLLAVLSSEVELQAILAHEVAHVVLDHALASYQSGRRRNRARRVLGNIVSGVSSAVAPGLAARGPVESTVYGLSRGLATQYLDREFIEAAGLEYSREQEQAANQLAQQWLLAHDRSPAALHSVLNTLERVSTYANVTHGSSFLESHPTEEDRREHLATLLEEAGRDPSLLDTVSSDTVRVYDTQMAAVLEHEAEIEISTRRFHSALPLLDRALRSDWTTARASLLKAIAVRNTKAGADGHDEALALLDDAEAASTAPEPWIDAERALIRMRQGRTEAARQHLTSCLENIEKARDNEDLRDDSAEALQSLHDWATQMMARLDQ